MNLLESLSACFWFSPENKRNTFASILAGVLVNKEKTELQESSDYYDSQIYQAFYRKTIGQLFDLLIYNQ